MSDGTRGRVQMEAFNESIQRETCGYGSQMQYMKNLDVWVFPDISRCCASEHAPGIEALSLLISPEELPAAFRDLQDRQVHNLDVRGGAAPQRAPTYSKIAQMLHPYRKIPLY
jgi:hypothetical protein